MVVSIPEGVYTMKDKSRIIKHNQELYQKASKKVKSRILDELSELLHMSREYLGSLLRKVGKVVLSQGKTVVVVDPSLNMLSRRGRKKKYGKDVEKALLRLWELTGFASSKHLVAFRLNHECLFNHPELKEVLNDSELPH